MSTSGISLFPPGSSDPSLAAPAISYERFLGRWHVVAATLPLWKDKKNVVISYTPIKGEPETTFDDLVCYNKVTDKVGKAPTELKGIDRLEEGAGVRWKWRGKGMLMVASSNWQLLGFNVTATPSPENPEWIVTYFGSTVFSPAGLDLYSRGSKALSDEMVEKIVRAIEALGGEMAELVKDGKMFRVPHDE